MTVALLTSDVGASMYTAATVRNACRLYGVKMAEEPIADALWVSVCDPDDLPILTHARGIAHGRPVIMGGFEGYCGVPYLAWADAVVVGEGFEFIRAWASSPDRALALPSVLTRTTASVRPSYWIDWEAVPLMRMPGGNRYYYLSGKGCKGKCKFCLTSWAMPHITASPDRIAAVTHMLHGGFINLVSNDSDSQACDMRLSSRSVRVADYLRDPSRYRATMIHFGIEGWTEAARAAMSKPISDADVVRLFDVTEKHKQRSELFFIIGYPGFRLADIDDFADNVLAPGAEGTPSCHIKPTYFDPCPHTPWSDEPIGMDYVDTKNLFRQLNCRNKRIRVFPTRSQARSAWRTVFHRCTPEQAIVLSRCPSDVNNAASMMRFRSWLNCCGLLELSGRQNGNVNDIIKTAYR